MVASGRPIPHPHYGQQPQDRESGSFLPDSKMEYVRWLRTATAMMQTPRLRDELTHDLIQLPATSGRRNGSFTVANRIGA